MDIFFLGAGFSQPAGLPLGDGLFSEILTVAKEKGIYNKVIKREIETYLRYFHAKTGKELTESQVNLEEFMSYIDIEHLLGLRGNYSVKTQEIVKNLIAYVLHIREEKITNDQFSLYESFCNRLGKYTFVYTFNYDTILEKALNRIGKPYRLYPIRYKHDSHLNDLVVDLREEVAIFKVHGSINWFDKSGFDTQRKHWKDYPHAVFDGRMKNKVHKVLDGPFPPKHTFKDLYSINDLERYFSLIDFSHEAPFIISPSHHKLSNLNFLRDFWRGQSNMTSIGSGAKSITIIGFSLPSHDEYIRQPLYWFVGNFQRPGESIHEKKSKLKIVDFKRDESEINEFKSNYRFVDQNITNFYFDGFSEKALNFIFSEE